MGIKKGREEERILMIKNLLKSGDNDSKILSVTGISNEQLEELKAE